MNFALARGRKKNVDNGFSFFFLKLRYKSVLAVRLSVCCFAFCFEFDRSEIL